jgi:hypothetical protein
MFQRPRQAKYEIIQDTRIETMRQLIQPLKKLWPNMVSTVMESIKKDHSPARVGEILAQEFSKLMEAMENNHRRESDDLGRVVYNLEKESKTNVDKLTKEKQSLCWEMEKLQDKNEELSKQVRIQNTLIADLHRKISNLTSAGDSASSI